MGVRTGALPFGAGDAEGLRRGRALGTGAPESTGSSAAAAPASALLSCNGSGRGGSWSSTSAYTGTTCVGLAELLDLVLIAEGVLALDADGVLALDVDGVLALGAAVGVAGDGTAAAPVTGPAPVTGSALVTGSGSTASVTGVPLGAAAGAAATAAPAPIPAGLAPGLIGRTDEALGRLAVRRRSGMVLSVSEEARRLRELDRGRAG